MVVWVAGLFGWSDPRRVEGPDAHWTILFAGERVAAYGGLRTMCLDMAERWDNR